jgi:hypothetical protein
MTDSGPAALQAQSSPRKEVVTTITLVLGFILFVVFLAGIIVTNGMITDHSSQTLTNINLAGRQSTLVERIAKDLVQIQSAAREHRTAQSQAQELSDSANVFNATQRALEDGGRTQYVSGQDISVKPTRSGRRSAAASGRSRKTRRLCRRSTPPRVWR